MEFTNVKKVLLRDKITLGIALSLGFLSIFFMAGNGYGEVINYFNSTNYFKSVVFPYALSSILFIIFFILIIKSNHLQSRVLVFSILYILIIYIGITENKTFYSLAGDNAYILGLISKYKYYNIWLVDYAIKDIPSYLPPLFFLIGGKIAYLFNIDAPQALTINTLLFAFFIPILVYILLRKRFDDNIVLVSVIVVSCLFHSEVTIKSYQTVAGLLSLIIFYKLRPKIEDNPTIKNYVIFVGVSLILYLIYFFHFIYIGFALALELLYIYQKKGDYIQIRRSIIGFGLLFVVALPIHLIPHMISLIGIDKVYKIYYGPRFDIPLEIFSWPIVLGLIYLIKTIDLKESQKTFFLIFGIILLFLLNRFFIFGDSILYIYKIMHMVPLVLAPFTIVFLYHYLYPFFQNHFFKYILMFFIGLYCVEELTAYSKNIFSDHKNSSTEYQKSKLLNEKIDLKNKVVFKTSVIDLREIDAFSPAFVFYPNNVHYGSFASRLHSRFNYVKKIDSVKHNPAAVANLLMNSPFEKIDFIAVDNNNMRFNLREPELIGQNPPDFDSKFTSDLLSEKYFKKVKNVDGFYELKYLENPENKLINKQTFTEKVALGLINNDFNNNFRKDLRANLANYTGLDLIESINFLRVQENMSPATIDSCIDYFSNNAVLNQKTVLAIEIEDMLYTPGHSEDVKDSLFSDHYYRKNVSPNGGILFYGPYRKMYKGKYYVYLGLALGEYDNLVNHLGTLKISSNSKRITFLEKAINLEMLKKDSGLQEIRFDFEISESIEDFEITYDCVANLKTEVKFDKIIIKFQ